MDKNGYLRYHLQREGTTSKTYRAHRLSMIIFNPVSSFEELEINHKDGNKINNDINNLEWCTSQENTSHAIKTGLKDLKPRALLTEKECRSVCELLEEGYAPKMIAQKMFPREIERFNSIILDIKRKRNWIDISSDYNIDAEYKYGTAFKSSYTIWELEKICQMISDGKRNVEIVTELFGTVTKSNQDLVSAIRNKRRYTNVSNYFF